MVFRSKYMLSSELLTLGMDSLEKVDAFSFKTLKDLVSPVLLAYTCLQVEKCPTFIPPRIWSINSEKNGAISIFQKAYTKYNLSTKFRDFISEVRLLKIFIFLLKKNLKIDFF